jgi:hypothetical protein
MKGNEMQASGKLSGRKSKALAALMSERTLQAAADKAEVDPATVWRWLQRDEAFRDAYHAALRGIVEQAMSEVQRSCGAAAAALVDVLSDLTAPASARVSASKAILESSLKFIELCDLGARIEALEEAMNNRGVA